MTITAAAVYAAARGSMRTLEPRTVGPSINTDQSAVALTVHHGQTRAEGSAMDALAAIDRRE